MPGRFFFHPDFTVGIGVAPIQRRSARGLYRRSGISPCPEDIRLKAIYQRMGLLSSFSACGKINNAKYQIDNRQWTIGKRSTITVGAVCDRPPRSNPDPPSGGWDSANPRAIENRPYDYSGWRFRDTVVSKRKKAQDPSTRAFGAAQDDACFRIIGRNGTIPSRINA